MKGKVFAAIFGGIALCGLVVILVGVLLGGRFGAITAEDGQLVYVSGAGRQPFMAAPGWVWSWRSVGLTAASPTETAASSPVTIVAAPFTQGEVFKRLDINITAGYVVVRAGSEYGLTVDGRMAVESEYDNDDGVWKVSSRYEGFSERERGFFLNGQDLTTVFTFTVPAGFEALNINLDMGECRVSGLELDALNGATSMGRLSVTDVKAARGVFEVDMGSVEVRGFSAGECTLKCDVGAITFEGRVDSRLKVDCSMGSVEAELARPAAYSYRADVGLGAIRVDGKNCKDGDSSPKDEAKGLRLELECGMGSVDIRFN